MPDRDPRLYGPDQDSRSLRFLDLTEDERTLALLISRRVERFYRQSDNHREDNVPAIWSYAHDQAIREVHESHAARHTNGRLQWDDGTWRGLTRGGTKA